MNPELHRVFEDELPRGIGELDVAPARNTGNFDPTLLHNVPNVEIAAFVARTAAMAVIDAAARERPELLESDEFKNELVTLLKRYLSR